MLLHEALKDAFTQSEFERQKELINALESRFEGIEEVGRSTIKGKLSKLFNGHREGAEFFFDDNWPHRLDRLCELLGVEASYLRALFDQPVVVVAALDNQRLITFLRERQRETTSCFGLDVVDETLDNANSAEDASAGAAAQGVRPTKRPMHALCDAASRHRNPIVVVVDELEEAFCDGRNVAWTRSDEQKRGFVLQRAPDLYEIPPPPPPRLFDDEGALLIPLPEDASAYEVAKLISAEEDAFRAASDKGELHPVGLEAFVAWWSGDRYGRPARHVQLRDRAQPESFPDPKAVEFQLWQHDRKLWACGPIPEHFRKLVEPWHRIHTPAWLDCWSDWLAEFRDPWSEAALLEEGEHPQFNAIIEAVIATGAAAHNTHQVSYWRKHVLQHFKEVITASRSCFTSLVALDNREWWEFGAAAKPLNLRWPTGLASGPDDRTKLLVERFGRAPGPTRVPSPEMEAVARDRLRGLVEHGAENTRSGTVLLRALVKATSAPLLLAEREGAEPDIHVDLAGGHLLEIRTLPLAGAVRPWQLIAPARRSWPKSTLRWNTIFYGGDLLLGVIAATVHVLEGQPELGSNRAERLRREADYDDD